MKQIALLSQTQYGLYIECTRHAGEAWYNHPRLYILDGSLDSERLCRAVETTCKKHPAIFTRIILDKQEIPFQTIDMEQEEFSLVTEEIKDKTFEPCRMEQFVEPFNLDRGRLFRIRLMHDSEHHYLFMDFHHIIFDATSYNLLLHDIDKAYNGETIDDEERTMIDVAIDEAEQRCSPAFEAGKQWYARNFGCADIFTQLTPDREGNLSDSTQTLLRTLGTDMTRVETFCRENSVFKSTFFTSAYACLLAKYNNEQQSLFSTIHSGRADKRLACTVGMFVKTVPVYAKFDTQTTVLEYLRAEQEQMSDCRKHEIYAFTDVMDDLRLQINSAFAWHASIFSDHQMNGKPIKAIIGKDTLEASLYLKAFTDDGHIQVEAEYNDGEYSPELIHNFLESYEAVVEGFLAQKYLCDVGFCTTSQAKVLDGFNRNDVDYDASQTIVSLFRRQAAATPQNTAVVFKDKKYTYAEVDDLSTRIAAYISGKGLVDEDVVSILIPRCEWMAIASLGALKAGCAYQPLDPTYPKERLNFMMQDAGAKLLIADETLRGIVDEYKGEVLLTKELAEFPDGTVPAGDITPGQLLILLYTSGSTGIPKGCELTHANLVAFCHWYQRYYKLRPGHNVAAYASYGFDACMMDMYPALTCGAATHIIPEDIRLDLIGLNDYFEQHHITHSFMTTQVGYQFATNFECRSLEYLSVGGEKLASMVPPQGYAFYNVYGPTECTIFTTAYPFDQEMKEIPIGKPLDNMRLYIVDPWGRRLPVGASGELWVSGPQVSRGYRNRPQQTEGAFINNPYTTDKKYARVYRTGDIVRYLPDGNIQFMGRRDGMMKIRGFRIELKEVESVIRQFPGIKDVTVQAFDEEGGKFIAAYIVGDRPIDIEALHRFIMDEKPPYMVPAVTMQIESIPLNQNMKVNKKALPRPEKKESSVENTNIPMNVLEEELHELVSGIVNNTDFGITTVLGYAGLTSISAIKLAVQVNKRYGVTLDSRSLVKGGTLQNIENEILKQMMAGNTAPKTVAEPETEVKTSVPLSYAQTGVYFDCLKNPVSTVYNIPYLLSLPSGTDARRLADTVRQVVESHPELSIHFTTEGDTIVQTTEGGAPIEVPVTEMTDEKLSEYKHAFVRPFNLQKAPLYRLEVVTTESGVHLLADIHHLVFDGGSTDLFIRQLCSALEGNVVEKEKYTYFDFVSDQQKAEDTDTFQASRQFFAERLQTCEGSSEIPADLPKSDEKGFIGEAVCQPDFAKAVTFCRQRNITPAHLFLAATAYVVSRHINNREVYLCTISSGRSNLKIADTVGMFVNTLALGLKLDDVTVNEFLTGTAASFDQTLQHEAYPFARITADYDFHPSIAYVYQMGVLSDYQVGDKAVGCEQLELNVPKFKICILIEPRGVVVQYDDAVYSGYLAQSLAESIVTVAGHMMEQPEARVRRLSIVSQRQEEELGRLRAGVTGNAPFKLFHECIGHFARIQPEHEALVAIDAKYTYKEMDDATNRIAAALRHRGVKERDRIALLLPRTSRLILSLFGVLKAGAAYIPCDPEYPADRIKLILEDSNARYIITTPDRMDSVPLRKAVNVEELLIYPCCEAVTASITSDDLAYLIYTSGSTGRPKGVMLPHEGICNYLCGLPGNGYSHAVATDAHNLLSVITISFDAAMSEIGMALFNGKTLVLASEKQTNNPIDLAGLMNGHCIDLVVGTPSRWQTWITCDSFRKAAAKLKVAGFGGEKLSDQLYKQVRSITSARIFNCYGPTETTVASNDKELADDRIILVGRPLLNVKEFIVDADGNELPAGVVGELYIGGRGVSRGYNNLDEMTHERFIDYQNTRIYKSGDYAKWLPGGDVLILGRTDHQIKLRGLRIELGEIENVIRKVGGMKNVVVVIRKINGKEHLCAYYTADREITPDALKAEISTSLTQYMVPTAYFQLEEIPMTPNGKTDMKALPEPQLVISSAYEAPVNETERIFCHIFAEILQMDKVGTTDNFFELGGTSLLVTRIVVEADKAGLRVTYGDVFANPTPRKLATLLTGESTDTESDGVKDYDYTPIDNLLRENTLDAFREGKRQQLGNVLLTGATGYLGIHILRELISSDVGNIYCLVRGKSVEAAGQRLKSLLFYYFSDTFEHLFNTRLHIVLGDVTQEIPTGVEVDTVFNCAAVVKHFSEGTMIEDVNIGSARRCVDFCLKKDARLIHVSTTSTGGLSVNSVSAPDEMFTEQRLYMGQYLGNQYIYSKFISERVVLDAVALHGLNAKVMRVGNLAARSTDGEFQANFSTNSFMGRIRVYKMLGCCPHSMRNIRVEFSPINEVAHAIVLLATTPKECTLFHPYNIHTQFLGDVLLGLASVDSGIRFVEQEDFQKVMDEAGSDPEKVKKMTGLLAYRDMVHGVKTGNITCDNEYTTQVLYRLGFVWSPTSRDYVERMLTAISGLGFFD